MQGDEARPIIHNLGAKTVCVSQCKEANFFPGWEFTVCLGRDAHIVNINKATLTKEQYGNLDCTDHFRSGTTDN